MQIFSGVTDGYSPGRSRAKKQDESSRADTKRNGVKYAVSFCSMGNMEHDAAAFLYGVRSIGAVSYTHLDVYKRQEYNSIMTDIQTYLDEFKLKFILGTEPLENFPEFVENIRNMNIERAIEIRQAEYDRYLAR